MLDTETGDVTFHWFDYIGGGVRRVRSEPAAPPDVQADAPPVRQGREGTVGTEAPQPQESVIDTARRIRDELRLEELRGPCPTGLVWQDPLCINPLDGSGRLPRQARTQSENAKTQRWTPNFGQVAKVGSRPRRRSLECHERDGVIRLS